MKLKRDPVFSGEAERPSPFANPAANPARALLRDEAAAAGCRTAAGRDEAAAEESAAEVYRKYYPLMAFLARRRFHVPEDDVKPLVHEVFVAYLRDRSRVSDVRAWLVGATANRCRFYWRTRGRQPVSANAPAENFVCDPADIAARVDVAAALRRLSPRCREVLRLRFEENYSSAAIAKELETTAAYARKLVYRCATAIREMLSSHRRRQ